MNLSPIEGRSHIYLWVLLVLKPVAACEGIQQDKLVNK